MMLSMIVNVFQSILIDLDRIHLMNLLIQRFVLNQHDHSRSICQSFHWHVVNVRCRFVLFLEQMLRIDRVTLKHVQNLVRVHANRRLILDRRSIVRDHRFLDLIDRVSMFLLNVVVVQRIDLSN